MVYKPKSGIVPLNKDHDRQSFTCGYRDLDHYLWYRAGQDTKKKTAACFVLPGSDGRTILGYYTLSSTSILLDNLPETIKKKLPKYPHVPATLLGRLAVHSNYQKQGIGWLLLISALEKSWKASFEVASVAIVVDAIDKKAVSFYAHHGFTTLQKSSQRLFLPLSKVHHLIT